LWCWFQRGGAGACGDAGGSAGDGSREIRGMVNIFGGRAFGSGFAKWEGVEEDVTGLFAGHIAGPEVRPGSVHYERFERIPFRCLEGDTVILHLGREFIASKRVVDGHMGGEEGVVGGEVEVNEDVGHVLVGVLVWFLGRRAGRCHEHLHVTRAQWVFRLVSNPKFSSESGAHAGDEGLDVAVLSREVIITEDQVVEPRLVGECAFHLVVQCRGTKDHATLLPRAPWFAIFEEIKNEACIFQDDVRVANEPLTILVKHLGSGRAKVVNLGTCEEWSEVNRPRSNGKIPPHLFVPECTELNCRTPLGRCASLVLRTISLDSYFGWDMLGGPGAVFTLPTRGDVLSPDWIGRIGYGIPLQVTPVRQTTSAESAVAWHRHTAIKNSGAQADLRIGWNES
jgi:hypothetical protein